MDLDYFAGLCKQKYSEHDIPKNWPQLSRPDHYDFLIHTIAAERGLDNKLSLGSGKKSDKAHAHALANRLLLFSYAIGELPITFGFGDARRKRFVNGRGDLYLLHGNEQFFYLPDGSVNQTDPLLLALYTAITKSSSSKRYKVFNWEETIDVVGSDSILKRVLCMEGGFTWQDVLRCPIPGHPKKKSTSKKRKKKKKPKHKCNPFNGTRTTSLEEQCDLTNSDIDRLIANPPSKPRKR